MPTPSVGGYVSSPGDSLSQSAVSQTLFSSPAPTGRGRSDTADSGTSAGKFVFQMALLYCSLLLVFYFLLSGALDSSALPLSIPSHNITSIAHNHHTN